MGKEWPKVQLMPFQFFLLTLNFIRQPISIGIHKGKDRHLFVWIKINVIAWNDIRSIVWRILAKLFISQHQLCISHFQNIDSSFLIKNLHKTITWKWVIEHLLCRWGSHLIKGLGRQVSSSLRYSNILIFFLLNLYLSLQALNILYVHAKWPFVEAMSRRRWKDLILMFLHF